MSNTIHSFTVVLGSNVGEEAAARIANAIRQLNNVISVDANIVDPAYHAAVMKERSRVNKALLELIDIGI